MHEPLTSMALHWLLSDRGDPKATRIADRHYNRQKPGTSQFVPPGRCLVLLTADADALWITSYPFAEYVKHQWAGAWVCSAFRNESPLLSSQLIREAVAITRWRWPEIPSLGMITFVDASKVKHKRDPGRCYLKAGFKKVGYTKGGLVALQLAPKDMPPPTEPLTYQQRLWI